MKLKTPKSISKRFRVTKTGKVRARKGGQDHFNSRESGNVTRIKRRDINISKSDGENIKKLLPYN